MKKGLILAVMLVSVLALGYSQSALSGTYRYSANAYITFTGNAFAGSWNSTSTMSGTYTVSGSRLTLNITGGPKAPDTWVWTIVNANTLRDQDGDSWGLVSISPQGASAAGIASAQTFNSAEALKEYLDRQPANSPDKPINVTMNASAPMLEKIAAAITSAGKYVNLEFTGNTLTSIGLWAFSNCDNLASITIPNSVISIESRAFSNCDNLARVTIGNSVTSIGWGVFWYCRSLASITIPDSVINIGGQAFFNCDSLTTINVTAGNSAYTAENGVLYNKAKTELIAYPAGKTGTFTIPDGVTSIGDYAFGGCNLVSMTIPDSVTRIGEDAFSGCDSLTAINVAAGNSVYTAENGVLYNKTKTELIAYPTGKTSTSFTIPNSVTHIGDNTFSDCRSLASIIIPNSVVSIGQYAFGWCTSLASITIPNSVTSIGEQAFWNCKSLARVTIGNGVTSIGDYAFGGCERLASITIPDSVASIGQGVFRDCGSLSNITIPRSVISIGIEAFGRCTSLTSVTFEGTIASGGFADYSFDGNLRDKYLAGGIGTYTRASGSSIWTKQ